MSEPAVNPEREILELMDAHAIPYEIYRHERVFTMEACLGLPFVDENITFCKNVFLCNRQQTAYYLLLLRPQKAFRTAVASKALGVSRLSFAPEEALGRLLKLAPGSVSPLGLYFDKDRAITLCYEKEVRKTPKIAFHPCNNGATVVFRQEAFWGRMLPLLGVSPVGVELQE
ncbi:MAG: YbaK/EbsC family protein [Candidatus Limiplasma sp.]|nr:YbaK/EbsC family protein [Candidatus Limiplasma sp.]